MPENNESFEQMRVWGQEYTNSARVPLLDREFKVYSSEGTRIVHLMRISVLTLDALRRSVSRKWFLYQSLQPVIAA